VLDAVRSVLGRNPRYCETRELEGGVGFVTNVKPSAWFLGTEMTIAIRPSVSPPGQTQLVADTKSQWFIVGDIFGYYNEYLSSFMGEVRAALKRSA
jgi:hypothetical protein